MPHWRLEFPAGRRADIVRPYRNVVVRHAFQFIRLLSFAFFASSRLKTPEDEDEESTAAPSHLPAFLRISPFAFRVQAQGVSVASNSSTSIMTIVVLVSLRP
jgi:hypothetical protein